MSQIKFKSTSKDGRPVEVLCGWDRPMKHFFATVFDLTPLTVFDQTTLEDEPVVYSSLEDDEADLGGGFDSPEIAVRKIDEHVEYRPPNLLSDLELHQQQNYGNVEVKYVRIADGVWRADERHWR